MILRKSYNKLALIFLVAFSLINVEVDAQITYTFTNCGATGQNGPTQPQVNATYTGSNTLTGAVTINTQGIQEWVVPATGSYSINAVGASGGTTGLSAGGTGISIYTEVNLIAGQVLKVVVGQEGIGNGTSTQYQCGGSGGGGSYVYTGAIGGGGLIIAAGGGGGGLASTAAVIVANNPNANFTQNGNTIIGCGGLIALGGVGGNGGGFSNRPILSGGPGAGWISDYDPTFGNVNPQLGGTRFIGGTPNYAGRQGGFGGGGASGDNSSNSYTWSGGGGGYSGGGAGHNDGCADGQVGGGAGSFLTGINQANLGPNTGMGQVVITLLCNPATPPSITCPSNISVNNDAGNCSAVVTYTTPNDPCAVVTQTAGLTSGAAFPVGTTTNTFSATNLAGTVTCSFTVTVVDAEAPAITCPGAITINTDAGLCTSTAAIGTATATDNCTVSPTITNNAPANFAIGNTTVVWTATDGAGNIDTCHQVVTVVDAEAPAITCPGAVTINTDAGLCTSTAAIGTATATDNCTVSPAITNNAPASFAIGNTTVVWTATDGAGNIDTCHQIVTVVDAEAPAITCPGAVTINTDAGLCTSTAAIGTATATDNCTVSPAITNNAPASFAIGNTTVVWTATDGAGNIDTCHQVVTVVDAELPTITCPANITVSNDSAMCDAVVTYTAPVGTDNCTGVVTTLTSGLASGATFPVGVTTVTYTVTDGSSNVDSCSFTVTVIDTTLPTIVCNANITVANDPNMCSAVVTYTAPVGTDNCTGAVTTLSSGLASGSTFPVGTTTITYLVTDASNNVDSCSFTVTVADSVAPIATCQNFTLYLDNTGNVTLTADSIDGGSTDDCAIDTLIASPATFTCNEVGANNVTLYVYDLYGNVDSCVAVVTVMDTIAPTATCQNINAYLDNTGNITIAAIDVDGGSTDACGIDSISISSTTFTCNEIGANNITLVVIDVNGNVDSCQATVTVMDTLAPTVSCPTNQNVKTDVTCVYEIADYTNLAANLTDNCDNNNLIITQTPVVGTIVTADNISNGQGQTTVTIIVQDQSGNIDSCDFIVDVECGAELSIPNVFTPNGDGKNDVWNIDGLDDFPDVTVSVFNRWGDLMFESDKGYTKSWDGTYNGTAAPAATYYYIIVLGSGEEGITGTINIIR